MANPTKAKPAAKKAKQKVMPPAKNSAKFKAYVTSAVAKGVKEIVKLSKDNVPKELVVGKKKQTAPTQSAADINKEITSIIADDLLESPRSLEKAPDIHVAPWVEDPPAIPEVAAKGLTIAEVIALRNKPVITPPVVKKVEGNATVSSVISYLTRR